MLLPHATVIALIDGKKFEIYRNTGDEAAPELTALPAPRLDTHNHSAASHHSSAGNHAGHHVSEDAHAIAATEWLNSQVLGHTIEHLVVFASPRTLGEMRRHYHKATARAVLKEFPKDLSGKQPREILEAMREVR